MGLAAGYTHASNLRETGKRGLQVCSTLVECCMRVTPRPSGNPEGEADDRRQKGDKMTMTFSTEAAS